MATNWFNVVALDAMKLRIASATWAINSTRFLPNKSEACPNMIAPPKELKLLFGKLGQLVNK